MANELVHGSVGTELTQAEWEGVGTHVFNSQATGDIVYASSATQLSRLAISGTATHILSISGGVPAWAAPAAAAAGSLTGSTLASGVTASSLTSVGTIATGVWEGTDVGVAYGGTGVSTLTDGGVLLGSGSGAITAMAVLTDGQMIVGNGSTDPVAESGATLRTSVGVGTGDSPQFSKFSIGGALDNQERLRIHPNTAPSTGSGTIFPVLQTTGGSVTVTGQSGAVYNHRFGSSTLAAGSSTTVPTYATVYIPSAATAGSNTTITANYALFVDSGVSRFDGNVDLNSTGTLLNVGASGNDWTANQLSVNSANDGGYNTLYVNNSSTSADSRARLVLQAPATSGASDPYVGFAVTSGEDWVAGIDNSNDDKWVLAASDSLGTSDVLRLDGRTTGVSSVTRLELANLSSTLTNSASAEMIQFDIDNADTTITGATTITTHQPLGMRIQAQRMSSSSTVTVNDASHLLIQGVPSPDTNVTFTNSTGLMIQNDTHGGTVTNQYGIRLATQTGGDTTNVGIDMGNNTLENVGASGNDWTSAALLHKGTSNSRFERTGSVTDAGRTALILQHTTDGDMADGFGVFLDFHLEDATASDVNMGFLGMERAGADNLSKFTLTLNNSGSYNEAIQVSAAGALSVDLGSGTGTDGSTAGQHTEILIFDDYDDPVELQRYTHMQSEKYSTIDERATSFEKMLDMGIISEVPEASSGYHMNLQPMVRLLAGGIYQNRERMDAQNEAMDARLKRIEQALGV